jgi:hypothetical protein
MAKLKELRKLSLRSEKAINIVGTVLSGMGLEFGQDQLGPRPTTHRTSGADSIHGDRAKRAEQTEYRDTER